MNTTSQKILFVRAMMVLLVMLVSVTAGAKTKSWALWSQKAGTLYFVRDDVAHKNNETYKGKKISQVWKIADNNDTEIVSTEQKARWVANTKGSCTKVVFDESFSAARPVNCRDWFNGFSKLKTIKNLGYLNTSKVKDMSFMFYGCKCLTSLDLSKFKTSKVKNMESMFNGCTKLKSLILIKWNVSNVTKMKYMFSKCSALTDLDLCSFNTRKVTNMSYMFDGCSALTNLGLKEFNTQKVTDMSYMFRGCSALTNLDLKIYNTQKVTNMSYMFYDCSALTNLILKNINTQKVTDMSYMFRGCSALTNLDLKEFSTQKVKNMKYMFYGCKALTKLNLTNFNTQNVTDMAYMFSDCGALTNLDLTNFNTQNVTDMAYMFDRCKNLESIYIDAEKWGRISADGINMFRECYYLVGQDGTTIASCDMNKCAIYAHADIGGLMKLRKGYMLGGTNVEFYIGEDHVVSAETDATVKVIVPAGNTLTGVTAKCGETDVKLSDDGNNTFHFTMPAGIVTVTATLSELYTLGGAGVTFQVDKASVTQAIAGVTVEFSVTAPQDKEVDEMTVMQGETPIEFTDHKDGTGQFMMPAGNVTVTATFKEISSEPGIYQLTTDDENLTFYVGDEQVTEAMTGYIVHVDYTEPDGKKLKTITAMQGETPVEVSLDADCYFEMPAGDVKVTATYVDAHKLESGTLVDEETGERKNDYVTFFDENINEITEAYIGDRVNLDIDHLTFDAGMYFAGEYTTTSNDVTILKDDDGSYFIMPDHDVTVTAVLVEQETLTIDLTSDAPVNLETVVKEGLELGELTSLMMQWEGYLVKTESEPDNAFPFHMRYYYDFNGDGNMDAVMIRTITNLDGASTYEIQRLEGVVSLGANYCAMLKSPGYPVRYKDVLMKFGESLPTIYGVFLYDGLENRNTLITYNGMTVDVGFPDRLLYKDGDWNTICLPFDLTVEGSPLDGNGVTVKTLESASLGDDGTLTMNFTEGSVKEMKAGVPYLIKWDKPEGYEPYNYDPDKTCYDLCGPLFRNVVLDNTLNPVTVDELVSFEGTYALWEYIEDAPSVLLVGAGNSLYFPKPVQLGDDWMEYATLSPFRGYFQLLGDIEVFDPDSDSELDSNIKAMVMDFGDEDTTGVASMEDGSEMMEDVWYDLSGRRLESKPSVKGIYIYNGKKVVLQ